MQKRYLVVRDNALFLYKDIGSKETADMIFLRGLRISLAGWCKSTQMYCLRISGLDSSKPKKFKKFYH